jgi:uncharacterized protein
MAHSDNFKIVQGLYAAYANADLDAFYRDLAPDVFWKESDGFPTPGVFRNKEEIVAGVFEILARDWVNFRYELEHLIDGNEFIVAVGTYRGSHGQTARSFESRASHVWHVKDGKIDRFEQFADTHRMQQAATE